MSAPDDAELDRALDDYVAAFREVERPSANAVTSTWTAIESQTRPAIRLQTAIFAVAAVAAAALLVLAWSGARGTARVDDAPPRSQTPYESSVEPTAGEVQHVAPADDPHAASARATAADSGSQTEMQPVGSPPIEAVPPALEVPEEPSPAATPPAAGPARARPPRGTAPAQSPGAEEEPAARKGPSALAEETALFQRIQDALADGRGTDALGLAEEHARRFPRGVFAHERVVARARALCSLGRRERAREVADAFVKAHPGSHLVEQMTSICR